jgi:folate-binding protein YgfZ
MTSALSERSAAKSAPAPGDAVFCSAPELGLLAFTGPDAEAFLQGQVSSDLTELAAGSVQLSSYNSPKGRMLATLLLWRDGSDAVRALVETDAAEPLRKRLSMYVLRAKVAISDLSPSHAVSGIAGPLAGDAVARAFGRVPERGRVLIDDPETLIGLPDGRYVVVSPRSSQQQLAGRLAAHASLVSSEYWRWTGIRAGVPAIGAATQDLFVPQTLNWDILGGLNFQKGCYPGQEIVARTQYLGRLKERTHLFHVDGKAPPPGSRIYGDAFGDQACGTVVAAATAPGGGSDLLAVVQLAALGQMLRLAAMDGPSLAALPLPYAIPEPVAPNRPKL